MRSLRGRLSIYLLFGAGVLLLVAAATLQLMIRSWLQREFDAALLAKARALVTLTKQQAGEVELDFADELMPEFERSVEPEYFELWLAGGALLERSNSLKPDHDLPREPDLVIAPRFSDLELRDGRLGRRVQIDFVVQVDDDDDIDIEAPVDPTALAPGSPFHAAVLVMAKSREPLDGRIRQLNLTLGALIAAVLAAIAVLVPWSVKLGLEPLDAMGRQVEALDAESLDVRIAVHRPPAELTPMIDRLNALLERLEQAFERERRLSSNLAHELRTPIAELRNLSEVGGRWPEDTEAARRFFDDAHEIARQMERIVVHLLALARSESGLETVDASRFSLAEVVGASWRLLDREADQNQVELDLDVAPALFVVTDRDKLELMISNLLANAVAYGPPGAEVVCRARVEDDHVSLAVANRADGLTRDDLPHLFDRFWRKDAARTGGQHAGLGLTLVRAFADLLGIGVEVDLSPERVFTITLRLPASKQPVVKVSRRRE